MRYYFPECLYNEPTLLLRTNMKEKNSDAHCSLKQPAVEHSASLVKDRISSCHLMPNGFAVSEAKPEFGQHH